MRWAGLSVKSSSGGRRRQAWGQAGVSSRGRSWRVHGRRLWRGSVMWCLSCTDDEKVPADLRTADVRSRPGAHVGVRLCSPASSPTPPGGPDRRSDGPALIVVLTTSPETRTAEGPSPRRTFCCAGTREGITVCWREPPGAWRPRSRVRSSPRQQAGCTSSRSPHAPSWRKSST